MGEIQILQRYWVTEPLASPDPFRVGVIDNFYLGYTKKAIIQCAISCACIILACCTMGITAIGNAAISTWGFVEGILILCGKIDKDGNGNPLKS